MHPSGGSAHKLCMCVHVCNLRAGHHKKCSWPGKWPQDPRSPPLLWPGSPGTPPVPEHQINLTTQPGHSVSCFTEASLGVLWGFCVLVCASSCAQTGKGQAPPLTCVCVLWPHWPRATSPAWDSNRPSQPRPPFPGFMMDKATRAGLRAGPHPTQRSRATFTALASSVFNSSSTEI